jgi:hypothetical protein
MQLKRLIIIALAPFTSAYPTPNGNDLAANPQSTIYRLARNQAIHVIISRLDEVVGLGYLVGHRDDIIEVLEELIEFARTEIQYIIQRPSEIVMSAQDDAEFAWWVNQLRIWEGQLVLITLPAAAA